MNSHKTKILKNVISSILVVLIFFCAFLALVNITFNALYIETEVVGFSMQPTINLHVENDHQKGDTILINKFSNISRNDIVVAKVSWYENYIIKRVVGLPGDKIEIKDETTHFSVYVNDSLLYSKIKYGENGFYKTGSYSHYQHYLEFLTNADFADSVDKTNSCIKLKENEYLLVGDTWGQTIDSLTNGPVKQNELVGKVELIVDVNNSNPFVTTWHFLKKIFSV